jgi:hypothetical protein
MVAEVAGDLLQKLHELLVLQLPVSVRAWVVISAISRKKTGASSAWADSGPSLAPDRASSCAANAPHRLESAGDRVDVPEVLVAQAGDITSELGVRLALKSRRLPSCSPASAIFWWRSRLSSLSAGTGRFAAVITWRRAPIFCALGGLPGEDRPLSNLLGSVVVATYASIPLALTFGSK